MSPLLVQFYISIVITTFLYSLISFRLYYPVHLKLFSIFLGITALTEIVSNYLLTLLHLTSNYPVYNIFLLIQYPLLAWFLKQILTSGFMKKAITVFIFMYPLFWIFIFSFVYKLSQWNTYGIMVGDLFIIIFAVRYLYELFTSERLISFARHSEFWIAVGLIFFSCSELPITGILNFLTRDWVNNRETILNLFSILQILNIIMYATFIYAFLCRITPTEKKL
jgi:hypothetical protein